MVILTACLHLSFILDQTIFHIVIADAPFDSNTEACAVTFRAFYSPRQQNISLQTIWRGRA